MPHGPGLRSRLHFLDAIIRSNVGLLRHPYKISWAVTYRCNLKCRMCNIWQRSDEGGELTPADADAFFSSASRFSWVGLTGGEPFLRADIDELVERVVKRCDRLEAIHVNTNGQLTDRAVNFAEAFRRRYPRHRLVMTISVDGPPPVHDRIRGVEGAWEKALKTFRGLKEVGGVKAQVGFTLSSENMGMFQETMSALRQAWPAFRPDDLNVNIFQQSDHYYGNTAMERPAKEALDREIEAILGEDTGGWSPNSHLRRTYLKNYRKYLATGKSPLPCLAFTASLLLDPYGDIYPCGMFGRRFMNVRDMRGSFESHWHSPDAKALRADCRGGKCPSCWSPCDAFIAIAGALPKTIVP